MSTPAEPVRSPEETTAEPGAEPEQDAADVGDLHPCPTCAYPLDAEVPWHTRTPEGTACRLTPPGPEVSP